MKKFIKILLLAISAAIIFSACDEKSSSLTDSESAQQTTSPPIASDVNLTATLETTTTTTPITTTAPPVTTKTTQATTKATQATTKATTQATTAPQPTVATGFNREFASQLVALTNEYKSQNGLLTSSSDGGWQLYADRLVKLMADKNVTQHGPGIYEIVAGGRFDNSPQAMMQAWKNSAGHNKALLDNEGGRYIASAVYTKDVNGYPQHYAVVVLMDMTYAEYYNSCGYAMSNEYWWEHNGSSEGYIDFCNMFDTMTTEEISNYFFNHNYQQFYPHLSR